MLLKVAQTDTAISLTARKTNDLRASNFQARNKSLGIRKIRVDMFPNLKLQIFRSGSHQNRLAKAVGIDETVLSKIIHGYRNPTASQRKILADYLAVDEAWLFEGFEVTGVHGTSETVQTTSGGNLTGNSET